MAQLAFVSFVYSLNPSLEKCLCHCLNCACFKYRRVHSVLDFILDSLAFLKNFATVWSEFLIVRMYWFWFQLPEINVCCYFPVTEHIFLEGKNPLKLDNKGNRWNQLEMQSSQERDLFLIQLLYIVLSEIWTSSTASSVCVCARGEEGERNVCGEISFWMCSIFP